MSKSYYEKLKDPKWQKKRLKILERDNFTCQCCGQEDNELHVHHIIYKRVNNPWDYEDQDLITYCKDCHKSTHDEKESFRLQLRNIINDHNLDYLTLAMMLYYINIIAKEIGMSAFLSQTMDYAKKAKKTKEGDNDE